MHFTKRRLLVVDDDQDVTFSLRATLKKGGFEVVSFSEGPSVNSTLSGVNLPSADCYGVIIPKIARRIIPAMVLRVDFIIIRLLSFLTHPTFETTQYL